MRLSFSPEPTPKDFFTVKDRDPVVNSSHRKRSIQIIDIAAGNGVRRHFSSHYDIRLCEFAQSVSNRIPGSEPASESKCEFEVNSQKQHEFVTALAKSNRLLFGG
jgi:hypothetical protein